MKFFALPYRGLLGYAFCISLAWCQGHQGAPPQTEQNHGFDRQAAERGKAAFQSNCGFCHGADAAGARAPNLVQSVILSHDENGNLVGPVIKNGRADKGMPAFPNLKEDQVADIVAFLHSRAYEVSHSAHVPGDYPLAKLLTGNAEAGRAFFNGAGGCAGCHSADKDLAGIAQKYSPVDLQQHIVYPQSHHASQTATVTTPDGQQFEGTLKNADEFSIGLVGQDGWFRSWPAEAVKVQIKDPLEAHRELTKKLTDAEMHNLFAYLETFK